MKKGTNWKLFFLLLGVSEVTAFMALPYTLALSPEVSKIFTPTLLIAQMIQSLILFAIASFFGLLLAKRVGFDISILEKILKGEKWYERFKSILVLSIGSGILAGILIILFSFLFYSISLPFIKLEIGIPVWKTFLVSFYGGIAEEMLLRLFFMTLLVWVATSIFRTKDGKPTSLGIWGAIVLSSVIFGLGHLPVTGNVVAITPTVITRAILLNGIGGIIFGWLYWKKGLESAMISHFTCDIVIHIIFPIVMSFFIY
jgi:membrane protease YdiL (CAAX protease family)